MFLRPSRLVWSTYWHARTLLKQIAGRTGDYDEILVWWQVWDKLKRKIRSLRGYEKFHSDPPSTKERYAFFPLQVEPEVSILLHSPYHANQIELVRAAAHALPITMMLYVKEHPEMVGKRTRAYYGEITKIPNVKLVDPRQPSFAIVRNAALTFTIVGTAGWESILFGKPVITFGDVFYNEIPFVRHCTDFNELPYMVKHQLEEFYHDEHLLLNYVSAIFEDSVAVDFYKFWEGGAPIEMMFADANMREFSQLLAKKIRTSVKSHSF
jgi:hypothetical protein